MKILHVIDSGGLYGAETMLLNLMREQVALGLEPILASIGEPGCLEKQIEREGARLGLRVQTFRMRPGPNPAGVLSILRYARREGVDLLHSHGYKGNIFFGLLPRCLRRLPLVSTVHGWTWTGGLNRMLLYERLDALALNGADRVVLVSAVMLQHPRLRSLATGTTAIVENGIAGPGEPDQEELDPALVSFITGGCTIGALGRLSPEKGFDLLLEALAALVAGGLDLRLVILGEGGERGGLEAAARRLGVADRLLMPGYLRDGKRYIPMFGVFAMPSRTEGLPMVLLEAMQAGVPIVASRVGGIPGVLQEGNCGVLVEPGSSAALADGIRAVLGNPAQAAQRVAAAGAMVAERFSSRAMAQKYLSIYAGLV
ncbi:glycosyltransferase [Geomonas sp. Red69]|uniref:glycosyltransferase n=1 Tax=Geomonas diazotrophica TaxID=2843197 RepID=UPI001C0F801D|nr:glycosyltransferase [Geomonas diazotrophica]MBU5638124.1 glycosyltransferase [Geomonas diazotrophica]